LDVAEDGVELLFIARLNACSIEVATLEAAPPGSNEPRRLEFDAFEEELRDDELEIEKRERISV